jgi:DNA-binding XRE family transcriptional regulator
MNQLELVIYLAGDQQFNEELPITTSTYVRMEVQPGPVPVLGPIRPPLEEGVPWVQGIQVRFLLVFPSKEYQQAQSEWDAAARRFAFHPAIAELLWRKPYYHIELRKVDIPQTAKDFEKPWENGGFYALTFAMSDETASSLAEGVMVPYTLGEEVTLGVPPKYWTSHIDHALFGIWRQFASTFSLFLTAADLSPDDDRIQGNFDLAYRQAEAMSAALRHPLRDARERAHLSMRELAGLLGLGKNGQNRINEWEHGQHIPSLVFARALAERLGFGSGEQVRQCCQDWQRDHVRGGRVAIEPAAVDPMYRLLLDSHPGGSHSGD